MVPGMRIGTHLPDGWQHTVDPAWLEGWHAQPFALAGGTTDVVVMGPTAGSAPPLLLLPPLPGFKEAWIGVAHLFARKFRVVTFDLRARFVGPPSWHAWLEDLARIADAFAPDEAIVMGHSLGGALAQRWALARPERVRALVLSSSFARVGSTRGQWHKRYLEQTLVLASQRWFPQGFASPIARSLAASGAWVYDAHCDEHVLAFVRAGIRGVPIALATQRVRLAFAHDTRDDLPRITAPTLLVVGEREARWAREATEELARLIPDAEVRISPEVAHLHPISSPRWLAETVTEWVAREASPDWW